jgi:hypothetical protein
MTISHVGEFTDQDRFAATKKAAKSAKRTIGPERTH